MRYQVTPTTPRTHRKDGQQDKRRIQDSRVRDTTVRQSSSSSSVRTIRTRAYNESHASLNDAAVPTYCFCLSIQPSLKLHCLRTAPLRVLRPRCLDHCCYPPRRCPGGFWTRLSAWLVAYTISWRALDLPVPTLPAVAGGATQGPQLRFPCASGHQFRGAQLARHCHGSGQNRRPGRRWLQGPSGSDEGSQTMPGSSRNLPGSACHHCPAPASTAHGERGQRVSLHRNVDTYTWQGGAQRCAAIKHGRDLGQHTHTHLVHRVSCARNSICHAARGEEVDAVVKIGVTHVISPLTVGMRTACGGGRTPFPRLLGLDRKGRGSASRGRQLFAVLRGSTGGKRASIGEAMDKR